MILRLPSMGRTFRNLQFLSYIIRSSSWPTELELCRLILNVTTHSHFSAVTTHTILILRTVTLVRARVLKSSNQFPAYSFYAIELKLGTMILDISPHNRSASDFSILPRGCCGAAPHETPSRFTAYSSYPIKLKLDRMIPDINPHNRLALDFSISFQGALWGRAH